MSQSLRKLVRQRAGAKCEYCRIPERLDSLSFHWDHIISRKHRGPTVSSNLAWSCFSCNNRKQADIAGIDSSGKTAEIVRLFNPRSDVWREHFGWSGPRLTGKTPIGRVTVDVLGINLPHRVALRQFLMQEGMFARI